MEQFSIIIFLVAVLITLKPLSDRLSIPYPVLLVLTGVGLGFIPMFSHLSPDPEIIFLVFLPALLYDAASRTSWHDFRTHIRPISILGISLVFVTTVAVAFAAYYFVPGFTWPMAFLLGAIISPPDAVAASGIIKGLHLNRKVITILEGESLVNDASALIAYRYALAAILTGGFVFWEAGLQFLWVSGGGILIGLAVGFVLIFIHKRIDNYPVVETCLTLFTPYLAYLAAERAHSSGVLAVVTTGLIIAWRAPEIFAYKTRMRTKSVWDTLVFLLNGFVFILIGLQLPGIIGSLGNYSFSELMFYGMLISVITILVRILWVFSGAWSANTYLFKRKGSEELAPEEEGFWKNVLIVAWTGTRGVISMATALALPLTLFDGTVFPQRQLILFLCFFVIFVTLVVQGFSLPLLIRLLKVKRTENMQKEENELQLYLINSTIYFIDFDFYPKPGEDVVRELSAYYKSAAVKLSREIKTQAHNEKEEAQEPVRTLTPLQAAQLEVIRFQRELLLSLHKEGKFSDTAIRQVEREMDIGELSFRQLLPKTEP